MSEIGCLSGFYWIWWRSSGFYYRKYYYYYVFINICKYVRDTRGIIFFSLCLNGVGITALDTGPGRTWLIGVAVFLSLVNAWGRIGLRVWAW